MKNYQKKALYLLIFSTISNVSYLYSQTSDKSSIYEFFDNNVGRDNLNINNGVLHSEPFRPIAEKHRYYINEFNAGSLGFEDEIYDNVLLKYDIHQDQLIFKQKDQTDNLAINLIKDKVNFFSIKNKKFVNLKSEALKFPSIINGIYEENYVGDLVSLYIKHHKEKIKVFQSDGVYYNYIYKTDYIIKYNNYFYKVDSQKEVKKIFPSVKKEINNYYKVDKKLEHSDKTQFMENLTKQINSFLKKSST
ncbi:hypothetical protein [Flavobacterium branchiicola]|uniref:DKNYY family protein n=1 Tax=Flavobacterium branchiicola TaxID=1114875 RepID=A0ABV9P9X1_9FLAO|nr:hypothetical protein [Flavobacterium branchiicola]MBS7252903.1 hypothetical protein [Flavobacterium branchiicola]